MIPQKLKDAGNHMVDRLTEASTHGALAAALGTAGTQCPPGYKSMLWAWGGVHALAAILLKG